MFLGPTRAAALGACTSAPLSGLAAVELAGWFSTQMKKYFLVDVLIRFSRRSLQFARTFRVVFASIFLLDMEVEFHDNHEADRADYTLVVDLLQLGCVLEKHSKLLEDETRRGTF